MSLFPDGDSTDDKILTLQDDRYWILVTHDVVAVVDMILDEKRCFPHFEDLFGLPDFTYKYPEYALDQKSKKIPTNTLGNLE